MTTISSINKSPRLTEQEVHQAAQDIIDSGETLSSLALLRALGRGSLTTITKYIATFAQSNHLQKQPDTLSFTELPETLSRSTKLLAIKIWTESQEISNKELESQREVLQQAAKLSAERVKEAEMFSDEQTKRLEDMDRNYGQESETLRDSLNTLNIELKDKTEQLNQTIIELEISKSEHMSLKDKLLDSKEQLSELKAVRDTDLTELRHDNQTKIKDLKLEIKDQADTLHRFKEHSDKIQDTLEAENKRLDLQVAKQQISLDLISKRLEEEKHLREVDSKENKVLREKAALLEGELNAWIKIDKSAKQATKS